MATYKRVRGRFFGIRYFPYLKVGIRDFPYLKAGNLDFPYLKAGDPGFPLFEGRDSELKVSTGCWMPKITLRD